MVASRFFVGVARAIRRPISREELGGCNIHPFEKNSLLQFCLFSATLEKAFDLETRWSFTQQKILVAMICRIDEFPLFLLYRPDSCFSIFFLKKVKRLN